MPFLLLSVGEILLLWYMNWSVKFRAMPFIMEMFKSCLKHVNYFLLFFVVVFFLFATSWKVNVMPAHINVNIQYSFK